MDVVARGRISLNRLYWLNREPTYINRTKGNNRCHSITKEYAIMGIFATKRNK
jgi:hypothetical protein